MMRSALYQTNTLSWNFIVLAETTVSGQTSTWTDYAVFRQTSLCSFSLMLHTQRRSNKYQLYILWFDSIRTRTDDIPQYGCFESCQFRSCSVFFVSWSLKCQADDLWCLCYYCDNVNISQSQMRQIISICNMDMPRKRLNKYWCSVPHCLSDNRNISRQIIFLS